MRTCEKNIGEEGGMRLSFYAAFCMEAGSFLVVG